MKKKFLLFFLMLLCGVTFAGNRDQMKHWVVTNYTGLHGDWAAGNMTGFFNLMINGQIIQNTNYEVAGFIGDELIVSGSFPLVDQNYVYCFNLNGYDDPEESEDLNKIHFRIYDHANQMEVAGLSATFLVFELNVMVGSPDHPFPINFITGDTRWQKVTDASTLSDGDLIIMTSPTDPQVFYALSDEETTSGSGSNKIEGRGVAEVHDNNGILTWTVNEEDPLPQVMELYTSNFCEQGQYSIFAGFGYLYAAHSTKSQLKTSYDIKNTNFVWTIDIENGEAEVVAQGSNNCKNLRYNDGKEIFSCFTSGQDPVCIYKLVQAPQTQQYTVALAAQPTDGGTVQGAGTYDEGTQVTITATANTGYDFQYWLEGDNQITANPYTFTINGNVTYTAVFAESGQPYTVTFDPGTGLCTTAQITETGVGAGVILPSAMPCTGASQAGYSFAGWATASVSATSTAPTLYLADATYYPTEDCTLYAVYFSEGSGEMILASSLSVGNTAYLVYEKNDVTAIIKKEFSSIYTGGSTHYGNVADYTTYPSLQPLTVGEGTANNSFTFRTSDGKYLVWSSGNSLDLVDSISSNCSWTVSFNNYEATVNNVATTSRVLSYNSGSPRFATYGNMNQQRVNFYVVADAIYNSNPSCDYLQPATTPVISGPTGVIYESTATVTISCETAGANIYYTTDGTVPTTASTLYTGPITIDETTTVKAIAGGEGFLESGVASTTFTFGNSFANIAAFKAAFTANSTVPCRIMSDITFVYKGGSNYYVQDETAALLVYDPNNYTTNTFNNGDVISGGIYGTHSLYNGMHELKLTQGLAAGVAGTPVQPTIATVAEINSTFADYESRLLKVVDVNFAQEYTINSTDKTAGIVQDGNTMNVYNSFNNVNMTVDTLRHFDIIGFGAQFNNNKQLLPRDNNDIIPYYFVNLAQVEHGTIAADVAYCMPSTAVTLTATPDQHYSFGTWSVTDGTNVVEVANNSFNMPEADVTVSATFTADTYNVNVSILPNEEAATVTITAGPYTYNMEVTANVTPAEGYTFIKWTIGNAVFTTPEITFNVEGDTELIAYLQLTEYNVTVSTTEGGTATITPAGPYHLNDNVTITATPAEGYHFVNWTKGSEVFATEAQHSFAVTESMELVANFEENEVVYHTVTVVADPTNGGTVTGSGQVADGESVTITARPAVGYEFVNFTYGETTVTTSEFTIEHVTTDLNVVAHFQLVEYTITILQGDGGAGSIYPEGPYHYNDTVTIEAYPIFGYNFVNWTKGNEVFATTSTYTFAVTESCELQPNFAIVEYTINVTATEGGTATINPAGPYHYFDNVTISATPAVGYQFVNWTNGDEVFATTAEYSFEVEGRNLDLVAHFELIEYTINVTATEGGEVEIDPAGPYHYNDEVMITATAAVGYEFVNWTCGDDVFETTEIVSFNVTQSMNLVAHFAPVDYNITVTALEGGEATIAPAGPYHYGDSVTINAIPATGYQFVNWTWGDEVFATTAEYSFNVTGNMNLVANFELIPPTYYTVNVVADPVIGGTVTGAGQVLEGDSVTITATPALGYTFVNFTYGEVTVTTPQFTIEHVMSNLDITAHFEAIEYVVNVTAGEGGEVAIAPAGPYHYNDSVTITATPNAGYEFVRWTKGNEVFATTAVYTFIVTESMDLLANFEANEYTITVTATEGGEAAVTPAGPYSYNDQVTITATPAEGYQFVNWTNGTEVFATIAEYSFNVTESLELVANFELIPPTYYTVSVVIDPANGGTVTGAGQVLEGGSVTLTATPATGYNFMNFAIGDTTILTPEITIENVMADITVTAHFVALQYVISVTAGEGGQAAISPAGPYHYNDNVTITATPAAGYQFVNWTNGNEVFATDAEYTFSVTGSMDLVANFEPATYTVDVTATEGGEAAITPAGPYSYNDSVTISATAAAGYQFVNWTKGNDVFATTPEFSFAVTENMNLVANFELIEYTVNVTAGEGGQATITPAGPYHLNDNVTITATPAAGYQFVNWTVGTEVFATAAEYSFTVTENMTIVANFELIEYTIAVTAGEGGEATITPAGPYHYNDNVTITAVAETGYYFVNWTNGTEVFAETATYSFAVTESLELVANFDLVPTSVTIAATANPAEAGTITGAGEYDVNDTVTLTATAAVGYTFLNWTENGTVVATTATYEFIAETDRALVANFELNSYEITVTVDPAQAGTVTGAGTYNHGATATMTATPAVGYHFVSWIENEFPVSVEATYSFTVTGARNLIAHFELNSVVVTTLANPVAGGMTEGDSTYVYGDQVTVTATANQYYEFVNWTVDGEEVSTNLAYTFTATEDITLVANFEIEVFDITVLPCENGVIIAPESAAVNSVVTVTSIAYPMYELTDLHYYTTDPEEVTEIDLTTLEFVMPEANITIVGQFELTEVAYDVNNDGLVNVLDVLAIIQYVAGNNPTPFIVDRADVNEDGEINIADALALNALIIGMKGNCEDYTAMYDVINGQLFIESPVALAGYQFTLSAEPTVLDMPGFTAIGNWKDGEYILCLFNLNSEKEAGMYAVLDLNNGMVDDVIGATLQGCKVNMEKGTLSVNSFDETLYSVFPVPANTFVTVEGPSIDFVEVFNAMGQLVKVVNDINANSSNISVSELSAGSYLFRIHANNGVAVKSVVVVR